MTLLDPTTGALADVPTTTAGLMHTLLGLAPDADIEVLLDEGDSEDRHAGR